MGATDFSTTSSAKTAQLAFRKAQEEARYEDGHGGYTGTIAEVSSFRMVDVDAVAKWAIARLTTRKAHFSLAGQRKLRVAIKAAKKANDWRTEAELEANIVYRATNGWGANAVRETEAEACKRMRADVAKQLKALKGKRDRKTAVIRAMFDLNHPSIQDKWGSCGCVELKKGTFCFFGFASC